MRGDGRRASVARASWGMAPWRGVGVPTVTKRPRALRSKKKKLSGGTKRFAAHHCLAKFGEIPTAKQSTTSVRMGKHTGRSGIAALRSGIGHSWSGVLIEKVRSWSEMVRSVTEFAKLRTGSAKLRTGSAEITQSNPKTSRQTVNYDVLGDSVWT